MEVREAAFPQEPHAIFPPEQGEPTVVFNLELLLRLLNTHKALGAEGVVFTSTQAPTDAVDPAAALRTQQRTRAWRIDGYNGNVKPGENRRVAEGVIMPYNGDEWLKDATK